jgi:acetyltransferase-like isoleucine patch superfamily enzyme
MPQSKSVIFLGSNACLEKLKENCEEQGIQVHGVIDSDYYGNTETLEGIPVIGDENYLRSNLETLKRDFVFFLSVNWLPLPDSASQRNKHKRKHWIAVIRELELECISIISTRAKVYNSVQVGRNVFVGDFAMIEPRVELQDFVSVWDNCLIGHDSCIGSNSVLQRNVTLVGNVILETDVFLGPFSKICLAVTISHDTWVNPGVLIYRNSMPNETIRMGKGNTNRLHAYLDHAEQDFSNQVDL